MPNPPPLTPADLDRIMAYCEAATPGPWEFTEYSDSEIEITAEKEQHVAFYNENTNGRANANLVTEARLWLPRLVAAIRAAWGERDALKAQLKDVGHYLPYRLEESHDA